MSFRVLSSFLLDLKDRERWEILSGCSPRKSAPQPLVIVIELPPSSLKPIRRIYICLSRQGGLEEERGGHFLTLAWESSNVPYDFFL